jgi:cation diffusion facilitator CzcD-associated flavoprotein CzcO
MFTLGYSFRPWQEAKAIADGPSILRYVKETAREYDIERHIRFEHRVVCARFDSAAARWTVEARRLDTGETVRISCDFLFACAGYYRYDEGYTPHFPGIERYKGRLVHPQHWPADLDYAGKRVVVIGSGATAVTVVPAMAAQAAHVTMLQRSPSYFLSVPERDVIADWLRARLPARLAHSMLRWKNVLLATLLYQLSRRRPGLMRSLLRRQLEMMLPPGYDIDTHFKPRYEPWDQRMCLVPDGDLFASIRNGKVSMVTDEIETFTEGGLKLASGTELPADLVVTATGLNLLAIGGMTHFVDGRQIKPSDTVGYKGMMLSGVPNLAMAIGYTNASWTLKCDLVCHYVCRLLRHMDRHGYRICTPLAPDPSVPLMPFLDLQSGYVQRALDVLPMQGTRPPWRLNQNYVRDVRLFRRGRLEDEGMRFSRGSAP